MCRVFVFGLDYGSKPISLSDEREEQTKLNKQHFLFVASSSSCLPLVRTKQNCLDTYSMQTMRLV